MGERLRSRRPSHRSPKRRTYSPGAVFLRRRAAEAASMEAMHSSNWHVRYNAACSLEVRELDYSALIEVVGGRDRYAREMMMYRLDTRRMEAERGEGT